jgi:hypothetical protein
MSNTGSVKDMPVGIVIRIAPSKKKKKPIGR